VYGQAGVEKLGWLRCTVTDQTMYLRNSHHASGLLDLVEAHATVDAIAGVSPEVEA